MECLDFSVEEYNKNSKRGYKFFCLKSQLRHNQEVSGGPSVTNSKNTVWSVNNGAAERGGFQSGFQQKTKNQTAVSIFGFPILFPPGL